MVAAAIRGYIETLGLSVWGFEEFVLRLSASHADLNGLRSGASACGIPPSNPRNTQFNEGTRCRSQTVMGSGLAPKAAFGSKAVRPSETHLQPQAIASVTVA